MQVKPKLIELLDHMDEHQILYAYTFLSKLFGVPNKKEG